jgi:hypothetical protein
MFFLTLFINSFLSPPFPFVFISYSLISFIYVHSSLYPRSLIWWQFYFLTLCVVRPHVMFHVRALISLAPLCRTANRNKGSCIGLIVNCFAWTLSKLRGECIDDWHAPFMNLGYEMALQLSGKCVFTDCILRHEYLLFCLQLYRVFKKRALLLYSKGYCVTKAFTQKGVQTVHR